MENAVSPTALEVLFPLLGFIIFGYSANQGLKEGVLTIKGSKYIRSETPGFFWSLFTFEALACLFCLLVGVQNALKMLQSV